MFTSHAEGIIHDLFWQCTSSALYLPHLDAALVTQVQIPFEPKCYFLFTAAIIVVPFVLCLTTTVTFRV